MKTHMSKRGLRALSAVKPIRGLVAALVFGMLMPAAMVSSSFAGDEVGPAGEGQWIAAMPDAGSPPAPAADVEDQHTLQARTAEAAIASAREQAAAQQQEAESRARQADSAKAEPEIREQEIREQEVREQEVHELSVSPEIEPLLPEGRPAWVGAPPDLMNPRRHRLFVGSFPTVSIDDVDATLDEPMLAAVNDYIDEQVLDGHGASELHLSPDFIRTNLLDRSTDYIAKLTTSSGPMYQKWVVLEITPEHRKLFAEAYRQVEQRKRMLALGVGLAGLVGLTGVAHMAFNRRRRRYDPSGQSVVQAIVHEPEPVASGQAGRIVWLIVGCLGGLTLMAAMFLSAVTLVHHSRTAESITAQTAATPTVHFEPYMPPSPPPAPQPPGVSFQTTEMHNDASESRP